jgi:hypothetical protein
MKNILITFSLLFCFCSSIKSSNIHDRWSIQPDGSIVWVVAKNDAHQDHIEMSGKYISTILRYGVREDGSFSLHKTFVYPMLRTVPNNTHASMTTRSSWNVMDLISVNGYPLLKEQVKQISLKGILTVKSIFRIWNDSLCLTRTLFPSTDKPAFIEVYDLWNSTDAALTISLPSYCSTIDTDAQKGVDGNIYKIQAKVIGASTRIMKPLEHLHFAVINSACKAGETQPSIVPETELKERTALVNQLMSQLSFESPDSILNTMFAFSKIRACESIYETKGGPMHGPGGEAYYAAIWANDQAEYINPYFPFIGYEYGNKSALNAYLMFARYMNKDWKPIPSSIIAEGTDIWDGAGDRGDAAMIAYGASRYALVRGDKEEARELWPLIQWCLEYCQKKINQDGVVESNSDELEGRFPSGKANLNTSSLYYDALVSASYLNKELGGNNSLTKEYSHRAKTMRRNIEKYFGQKMDGYDTYAYYKGNDKLRSWICTPLVMGITERAKGTLEALFSSRLWTNDGLLSEEGSKTYWDRSLLYGLRGAFYVGEKEKALHYLKYYSERRLLGDHVPYAIEAWPEGEQRHLSAESGLYGRIITEGLFGIRPIGLHAFTMVPRLPEEWNTMSLHNMEAFGSNLDMKVTRIKSNLLNIQITNKGRIIFNKKVEEGKVITIHTN